MIAVRTVKIGLLVAASAFIGGSIGFYAGWHGALNAVPVMDYLASVHLSQYLTLFRKDGSDPAYEDALRSYLHFLDGAQARNKVHFDERMYALDRALTLIRLSQLLTKRGASTEAAEMVKDAEAVCPQIGVRDCSLSRLAFVAKAFDEGLSGPDAPK